MVSSYQTTKRATSFFVCLLLVVTLTIGSICPVHAAESTDPIPLDQYSFFETICSMFNSFYIPNGMVTSELSTWNDRTNFSSQYYLILSNFESSYNYYMKERGFQYTNPAADNYVHQYLWCYNNSSYSSIYNVFKAEGKLDFTGSLNENEFILIRDCFNEFIKMMYDFNYNLEDYTLNDLAQSVPVIPVRVNSVACFIGYGFPGYVHDDDKFYNEGITSALDWIDNYSAEGFSQDHYILTSCNRGGSEPSSELLDFYLVGTYLDDPISNISFSMTGRSIDSVKYTYIYNQCVVYNFDSIKLSDNTWASQNTKTTMYNTKTGDYFYAGSGDDVYVSPLIGTYKFGSSAPISNWGRDLLVGTNESWNMYGGFNNDCMGVYHVPYASDVETILKNKVTDESSADIIDVLAGTYTGGTGSEDVVEPEVDYDRIDSSINDLGNQIENALGNLQDELLHGGNYGDLGSSNESLDAVLKDYTDMESQLQDFTNLDSAITTFWNTSSILDHATNISTVSTYFMTLWDSFGPYGILLSLSIALGLAAFLLKI